MELKGRLQGLEWLIEEVEANLHLAYEALESYLADSSDEEQIGFCLGYLHQIHGSLKIIEIHGPQLLAEELEKLAESMLEQPVSNIADACDVMIQAILELPAYLRQVIASRHDQPETLLLLLNELRAVRNEPLVSESIFFSPNMAAAENLGRPYNRKPDQVAMSNLLRKLRQMYQFALAGVVKDETIGDNFGYLDKVFSRLKELSKGLPREPLWTVVLALLEGISSKEIALGYSVKKLLHELDHEIEQLATMGFEGLSKPLPSELLKNLLFYIALARSDGPRAVDVRREYGLDVSLPETQLKDSGDGLSPQYHPQTAKAIVEALTQEIGQIKDSLDHYSMDGDENLQLLDDVITGLRRVRDSLAVLGRNELSDATASACEQITAFRREPSDVEDNSLSLVASQLLAVEAGLENWLRSNEALMEGDTSSVEAQVEVDRAEDTLLEEARTGLDKVKESIVDFITSQWEHDRLQGVPETILNIRGALEMMHLPRAAEVLSACHLFLVEQVLDEENVPSWKLLDALADAITSIEHYLEYVVSNDEASEQTILTLAENSVAKLGYPVNGENPHGSETALNTAVDQPSEIPASEQSAVIAGDEETEDDEIVDPDIINIYLEEMGELKESIDHSFNQWRCNPEDQNSLADLRRCFHTLKGSSRMVKARSLGELGRAVENLLNKLIEKRIAVTSTMVALVDLACKEIPGLVEAFKQQIAPPESYPRWHYVSDLMAAADALAKGETPELPVFEQEFTDKAIDASEHGADSHLDQEAITDHIEREQNELVSEQVDSGGDDDNETNELLGIFSAEAEGHLKTIQSFVNEQLREAPVYSPVTSTLQSALHTLKGSARMAGIAPIADLVSPLEHYTKELYTYQLEVDDDIVQLFADAVVYCQQVIEPMQQSHEIGEIYELDSFLSRLAELRERSVVPLVNKEIDTKEGGQHSSAHSKDQLVAPERLNMLMTEGMQNLLDVDKSSLHFHHANGDTSQLEQLRDELKQLATAASHANVTAMEELSGLLSAGYDSVIKANVPLNDSDTELLQQSHEALLAMVDSVAANQHIRPVSDELSEQLQCLVKEVGQPPESDVAVKTESLEKTGESASVSQITIEPLHPDEIDLDILEAFISEADELLEDIDQALQGWERDWSSKDHVEALKRSLHTLKGGARMAGMEQLGSLGHDFETEVAILESKPNQLNKAIFQGLLKQQDHLLESINAARNLFNDADEPTQAPVIQGQSGSEQVIESITDQETIADSVKDSAAERMMQTMLPQAAGTAETQFKPDAAALTMPEIKRENTPQEVAKVPAALLERLVNLAGETSISRGRVEQQVSEFTFTLEEMEATILRLKDQVRRIGMETEAQVMFRQEQLEAMSVDEGFDPLEMDRYSQLQQLSRSLLESSSDLQDLKNTLVDKYRGADAELHAQSRINTDLQEQLMQARMVPFLRMVPRLRRIVRQLSSEQDKNVELYLANVEGEMDRVVMEQMLAPLEHMIRNAIDHGIESEQERQAAGKSKTGAITIGLVREGGDILIQLSDDGRGLNVDSIRRRAIEKGLLDEQSDFSDQDIIQFIFQPGFSTTEEITQVSGRGVGMDVVNSQVRELGGFVETVTRKGEGTQFSIRLPFTVSVNRALMIDIGEDRYALPLNSVDGVVRVSSMELQHYYRFPDARLEYAGGRYEVRYLGSLLSDDLTPKVDMSVDSVFLVLVHSETRLYAVQVDRLAGSSEIVVKSLGPQFSKVPGLSGATLLGDGRVVVILDLLALLRTQLRTQAGGNPGVDVLDSSEQLHLLSDVPTVMVVDDSVTVRKVASRFLEREGFQVITARDGVEAMQQLQENQPNIMLLDIEMPRMDGFEVARRVKESEELRHIPIIMMTSRTGEKHRERAVNLGVEGYLGKPYQEEELLEAMTTLMDLVE